MDEEEKSTCPKCHKDIDSRSELTCRHCNQAYHTNCHKISSIKLELLIQAQKEGEEDVFWVCQTCRRATVSIKARITVLNNKIEVMVTKLESFVESVKKTAKQRKASRQS